MPHNGAPTLIEVSQTLPIKSLVQFLYNPDIERLPIARTDHNKTQPERATYQPNTKKTQRQLGKA